MTREATPGPWKVFTVKDGPNKGQLLGVGEADSGSGVADAYGGLWGSGAEKMANAYLIAAAPCMAKALIQCRDQFAFYAREHAAAGKHEKATTNQRFADLADTAIAKTKPAHDPI